MRDGAISQTSAYHHSKLCQLLGENKKKIRFESEKIM
jgi:hypothetical protein